MPFHCIAADVDAVWSKLRLQRSMVPWAVLSVLVPEIKIVVYVVRVDVRPIAAFRKIGAAQVEFSFHALCKKHAPFPALRAAKLSGGICCKGIICSAFIFCGFPTKTTWQSGGCGAKISRNHKKDCPKQKEFSAGKSKNIKCMAQKRISLDCCTSHNGRRHHHLPVL